MFSKLISLLFSRLISKIENIEPNPAIYDAIDDGDIDQILFELKNSDVNQTHGQFQTTALYHAMSSIYGLSLDIVTLLLDNGADPKIGISDQNVLSGLGFANTTDVDAKDLAKVIRRCVALGADIELRSDKLQWTPLIYAASEWNPVACEALLLAGADITAKSGNVERVCFAGEDCFAYANGDDATTAVLKRFV